MAAEPGHPPGHPMKVVVRRTGLSPHVIRIWEKRYGAVSPQRTPTNRRLYSDADIARLQLLRRATLAGHSIGQIANLPIERLRELVAEDEALTPPIVGPPLPPDTSAAQPFLDACLAAAERLDAADLEATLLRARVALSPPRFMEQVIVPLMHVLGQRWREGSLRIMHEHLASAVIRTLLGELLHGNLAPSAPTPRLLVTTPAGQQHEIGALMAATTAASEGWGVTYLGPSLPAEDIAAAARVTHARAIALSLVHPTDDPHVERELTHLRRYLGPEACLIVGGRAAEGYHKVLQAIGAHRLPDMAGLRAHLEALRNGHGE